MINKYNNIRNLHQIHRISNKILNNHQKPKQQHYYNFYKTRIYKH